MKRYFSIFFLLSLFCLVTLGCASAWKKWGISAPDADIKAKFERYEFVADYNYFYTRLASSPDAILGIQREFELVRTSGWKGSKTSWQQFEPEGAKIKEFIEAMSRKPGRFPPFGYSIKAPTGDQIGVMYATPRGPGSSDDVQLLDGNRLSVTPSVYRPNRYPAP